MFESDFGADGATEDVGDPSARATDGPRTRRRSLHRLDNEHIYASLRVDAIIMACAASPWYKDSVDMHRPVGEDDGRSRLRGAARRRRWRIRARASRPSISSCEGSARVRRARARGGGGGGTRYVAYRAPDRPSTTTTTQR